MCICLSNSFKKWFLKLANKIMKNEKEEKYGKHSNATAFPKNIKKNIEIRRKTSEFGSLN
jgi:hypothetical protein